MKKNRKQRLCKFCDEPVAFQRRNEGEHWVKVNPDVKTFFHREHGTLTGSEVHTCEKGGSNAKKKRT